MVWANRFHHFRMVLVRAWIIGKKKKKMVGKLKQFFFVCQFLSEYRLDGG